MSADRFKVIRNGGQVIIIDMNTCQKKILSQNEYLNKTDEEIIESYSAFCVRNMNERRC